MAQFTLEEILPTAEDFNRLRESVGWGKLDNEIVQKGLSNSLYSLCVIHESQIIGMCRLVGDGALKIYIEELIIDPKYQRKGLGKMLMIKIMEYISYNYKKGCSIGLFANTGLESFYNSYGFIRRENDKPGMKLTIR
jgi:ribosomal protein S18 acetylase RimI-like enzyme